MKSFLAIGLNHFLVPGNDLAGCVPDANLMGAVAGELKCDYVQHLFDFSATKRVVMSYLTTLVAKAQAGDLTYIGISWSGHGTHYNRPAEADGLGEALVCYDITARGDDWDMNTIITDVELKELLNSIPVTCTVEVWLDTCYSGGMDRGLGTHNRFMHNPGNTDKALRLANTGVTTGLNKNIIMWQACSEAQESADGRFRGAANGVFTWWWYQSYMNNRLASRVELLLSTRKCIRDDNYDQFPRLKCWNDAAQMRVGR